MTRRGGEYEEKPLCGDSRPHLLCTFIWIYQVYVARSEEVRRIMDHVHTEDVGAKKEGLVCSRDMSPEFGGDEEVVSSDYHQLRCFELA